MALVRTFLPFDDKQTDTVLILLAGAAFFGSVVVGTLHGGPDQHVPLLNIDMAWFSTLGWALLGLAALFLFREAVEDVWWPSGLWVVGAYVATGLGAVFLTVGFDEGLLWWFVGLVLVGLGCLLQIQLWLNVYTDRAKLIRANPEADPEVFALGMWNLGLPLYILTILATYYFWSLWYLERSFWGLGVDPLKFYIFWDMVSFGVAFYLLYVPQQNLGRYFIREVEPVGEEEPLLRPGSGGLPKRLSKRLTTCLACKGTTRLEQRACPTCETSITLGWCPTSEHYTVICPECGSASLYGQPCPDCSASLTGYRCPNCANTAPLRQWTAQ